MNDLKICQIKFLYEQIFEWFNICMIQELHDPNATQSK